MIRPVCDSSLHHKLGSLNSRLPVGPSLLNNMKAVFEQFRINHYALVADLHRAYRSTMSCYTDSRLRLTWYPANALDPNNTLFKVLIYLRVSYGDSLAAGLLEKMLREWIAPQCKTEEGKLLLEISRFVDDILKSGNDPKTLWAAMADMGNALNSFGFRWKRVFSNGNWHLQYDSASKPEDYEVIFHHHWDWAHDTIKVVPNFYVTKKLRGD